jgi:hypothetical protein
MVFGVVAAAIAAVGLTLAIAQTKPTPKDDGGNSLSSVRIGI